jgi:hypothetical protein
LKFRIVEQSDACTETAGVPDAAAMEVSRIHQGFPLEKDYGIERDVSNQPLELFT